MNVRRTICRAALLANVAVLCACKADFLSVEPTIPLRAVLVDTASGKVILAVTPAAPAEVEVVYQTSGEPALSFRSPEPAPQAQLLLSQLRPGRVYEYDVRALNSDGVPGPSVHGMITVPALPAALQGLHFQAEGTLGVSLVMLEIESSFSGFVAVNQYGEPVWHWPTAGNPQGFTTRANGNFVFLDGANGLYEVSPDGKVVHQLPAHFNGNHLPHHDVLATPRNTLLFIAQDPALIDGQYLVGESIWEWTPESGEVVKRWSSFDFYDPLNDVGPRSTNSDLLHANSLAFGDHGNVLLSLNWLSQVISIAPDWRTIEWRMGGPRSTIAVDAGASFQGQHTAQLLPNGHLLMFNNNRDREGADRNSRALELSFSASAGAKAVWSWTPSSTQYDPYVGAARRLDNGNTLVFFGMRDGFAGATGPMAAYEVRPSGSVAWKLTYDGGNINYRATPLESIAGEQLVNSSRFALHSR